MIISSRTPGGRPSRCPVCGKRVSISPSYPSGDAPCPHCGVLLWFAETRGGFCLRDHPHAASTPKMRQRQIDRRQIESPGAGPYFRPGDPVRVKERTFQSFDGEVHSSNAADGLVAVVIEIFGRRTPVEFENWQLEFR